MSALPDPPATPLELFLALVAVPSPTGHEGRLAAAVGDFLARAGIGSVVDGAAELTGSDTGNVIARVGEDPARSTVLLVAHLDTVQPLGSVVAPVVGEDGVVRSGGDTILGADNKSAVAAVLSTLLRHRPGEHANVVAVFSTSEERGRMGVTALGPLVDEVDLAFPVDGSWPVGTVLEAALGQVPFDLRVHGRAAHAAKAPEDGVHAIKVAAEVVARLELGWSGDTTLNVSAIGGGGPTNVVPDHAEVLGEARGYDPAAIDARLAAVRAVAEEVADAAGARVELVLRPEDGAPPFPGSTDPRSLAIARAAAADAGLSLDPVRCTATLEANELHALGLPTLGIASGGRHPHAVDEHLPVAELDRLVAFLDALLLRA